MPFFSQGVPKDKLTILFFSRCANLDLTREQLHRAMVENDCMSYFDFQSAMYEMEEDGLIAAIPRPFGQGYRITSRGEDTLSMFEESLPYSLRQRLSGYADAAREPMRRETQLLTSMEELYSGAYMVRLKAVEQNSVVLDLSMKLASRAMAQRVRRNWATASEDIYGYLLERLLYAGAEADEGEDAPDAAEGSADAERTEQTAVPAGDGEIAVPGAGAAINADTPDAEGTKPAEDGAMGEDLTK